MALATTKAWLRRACIGCGTTSFSWHSFLRFARSVRFRSISSLSAWAPTNADLSCLILLTMCTNKHPVQLKIVEVWIPNHHQPPTSTNVPSSSDASVGFWNFSKELLVGLSTRFTRHCLSLNVSKCFQPRLQFWEYAAGLLSHVFSQPRAPNSRTNFSPFLQRAANDANPTWLSQRCPAWDVLAYQPRWQNDVKPWSSKPWQVAKRDGPRCFLVCYITCILAPHPHFVVFCGDCAWRTWRYWLEVVLHFNIFYQNMLTHFTVVMSPPELTTIEPAMATFSEAVAPGVAAFGTGVSCPGVPRKVQCHESKWKSIGHIACVLWDVDEEITSFSLRLRHAFTCEKRAAKGKNCMPNIYRIYLYLNNSKVLKVLVIVLSILYHILIFSETCRGPFMHSAKSQLSYTPSLPSIKAVEPVKGCCVTWSPSHHSLGGTWWDLSKRSERGKRWKVGSQHRNLF